MLEVEGTHVQREHEDYLLLAAGDLRQKLQDLRNRWRDADQSAERLLYGMSERESLAWQCLITREFYLILELYGSCLRTAQGDSVALSP